MTDEEILKTKLEEIILEYFEIFKRKLDNYIKEFKSFIKELGQVVAKAFEKLSELFEKLFNTNSDKNYPELAIHKRIYLDKKSVALNCYYKSKCNIVKTLYIKKYTRWVRI